MGVKVTLQRLATVNPYAPMVRLFEEADYWTYNRIGTNGDLAIVKGSGKMGDEGELIAQFATSGIESVEFA